MEQCASEVVQLAARLEDEVPWETCSKVLDHTGWVDVVETIKAVSPEAYDTLRRDLLKPVDYFTLAKAIVRQQRFF